MTARAMQHVQSSQASTPYPHSHARAHTHTQINVKSAIVLIQEVKPHLKRVRGWGHDARACARVSAACS